MIDHYVQTDPMPLTPPVPVRCSICRALFTDDQDGHRAHVTVFGHSPVPPEGGWPQPEEA